VNPLTFLPPRRVAVAQAPRVGDAAPPLPGAVGGRPMVIAFLRHVGCPFAEATLRALGERAQRTPEVRFVAVSHAPPAATERWRTAVGDRAGGVEMVIDERRELYGAWGLGTSSLAHFLGPRSLGAVGRLARAGIRNRHPVGTRWQSAGTFAVDAERVVRFVHLPEHAGALPDLGLAVAELGVAA
jgi:hypothetical protein